MKKSVILAVMIGLLAMAGVAMAHSGVNYNTTDPAEVDLTDLSTQSFTHVDAAPYKGWWAITLKNMTASSWSSIVIQAGDTDLVAIVQSVTASDFMVDEFGYSNLSVTGSPAGTVAYSGALGARTYDNGSNGLLWRQAVYAFNTPINTGQSARFYVYTDNSYYDGTYASSFSIKLTPNAVPEPGSIFALSAGLMGLLGAIKRRK